jgi:hypothetical protein
MSNDHRRYSEDEFALIIRKAFELEDRQSEGVATEARDRLSLEDIKVVAREVGLDPALVDRAAAALPLGADNTTARILGGPSKYQMEYTASGQLSEADLGRVIDAIRRATGQQGKVTEVFGSLEWQTVGEVSQIHVTVSPRDKQTSLKVMGDRGATGALLFGIIGIAGGLVSTGIAGAIIEPTSVAGVVGLVTGCLGTGFLTARTIWATTAKGFRSKLRDLMTAASKAIDESLEPAALEAPQHPKAE